MTDLSDDALEALGLDEDEAIVEIVGEEQARRTRTHKQLVG